MRAVYSSLDPATAISEVAVHKGFRALDTVPHTLTALTLVTRQIYPADVNPNWLRPRIPSTGQESFGDALLASTSFY